MGFDVYHQYDSEKIIHFKDPVYIFLSILDVENLKECIWSFSYLVEYNKKNPKIAVAATKMTVTSREKGEWKCAVQGGYVLLPGLRSSVTQDVHLSGPLVVHEGCWSWRRESGRTVHPLLSLRAFSKVPFSILSRTSARGHDSLHWGLLAGQQCAHSKEGSVTKEKGERIVGAGTSHLGHHHLTSFFVSHPAIILVVFCIHVCGCALSFSLS